MIIHDYSTAGGKNVILQYIERLPIKLKIEAYLIRQNIVTDGLKAFEILDTRHLKGKIYEIRFSNQRIMYLIKDKDNVYFLHICKKQKNKTESKDLQKAIQRARELGYRY